MTDTHITIVHDRVGLAFDSRQWIIRRRDVKLAKDGSIRWKPLMFVTRKRDLLLHLMGAGVPRCSAEEAVRGYPDTIEEYVSQHPEVLE